MNTPPQNQFEHAPENPDMQAQQLDRALLALETEIEGRKLAEGRLRENVEKYQAYIALSPVPLFISHVKGHYLEANPAACELTGHSLQELQGMSLADLVVPEDYDRVLKSMERLQPAQRLKTEFKICSKQGTQIDVEQHAVCLSAETIMSYWLDIRDRKETEVFLTACRDLVLSATDTTDPQNGFRKCLESTLKLAHLDSGGIYWFDEKKKGWNLISWAGLEPNSTMVAPPVVLTGDQPNNNKSIVLVPIQYRGKLVGCFNIASQTASKISDASIQAVQLAAAQVGVAMAQIKAQQSLAESEARYRLIFDHPNDAMFITDSDGNILEANQEACDRLGFSKEELCTKSMRGIAIPDSTVDEQQLMQQLAEKKRVCFETSHRRRDGSIIPTEIVARQIEFNGKTACLCAARDISVRKEAEARIREQAALLEVAHDAICVQDMDGRIIFWNRGAVDLLGLPSQDAIGKTLLDITKNSSDAQISSAREQVLRLGEWTGELQFCPKSGKTILVQSRWSLARDGKGNPKSILVVNTDITQKKRIEEQYLRTQRMEVIGAMASGIAHDLNNVLAPILLSIDSLRSTAATPETEDLMKLLGENAQRAAAIVKQLLLFGKGNLVNVCPLRCSDLLSEIAKLVHETFPKTIRFEFNTVPNLWMVNGDNIQLHQVFLNLCLNARESMNRGGLLRMDASNIVLDETFISMNGEARPGPYILVVVSDNGCGISSDVLPNIFDPFFNAKKTGDGSGLALAIAQSIVKNHGGFIRVASQPDLGTRFQVYLPAMENVAAAVALNEKRICPKGHGELILLVDDESTIQIVTKKILISNGYRVLVGEDGAEGVAYFASQQKEIPVVIADLMMPNMDGRAFMRAVKRINPVTRIIAISGHPADEVRESAIQAGADLFLAKPFTADDLLFAIHKLLITPAR